MTLPKVPIVKGIILVGIVVMAGYVVTGFVIIPALDNESINLKKWLNADKVILPNFLEALAAKGSSYPLIGYSQFEGNVFSFQVTHISFDNEQWLLETNYGLVDQLSFNLTKNQITELAVSLKETLLEIINGDTMSFSTYSNEFQENPERYIDYANPRRIETCYYGNDSIAIRLSIFPDRVIAFASSYTISIEYPTQNGAKIARIRSIHYGKTSICYYLKGNNFDELIDTNKYLIAWNSLLKSLIN
jgi:hypothetical protein